MSRNHRRLNKKRWQALRLKVLDRDQWRCLRCSRAGRLEVDHVVPMEQGGATVMSNLGTLCIGCHQDKTRGESIARLDDPARSAWRTLVQDRMDAYNP